LKCRMKWHSHPSTENARLITSIRVTRIARLENSQKKRILIE
jgi:hypothetical protein